MSTSARGLATWSQRPSLTDKTSGTAILTHIYNARGWHPTGCTAVGLMSLSLLFLFTRGPHEHGWVGWRGGASLRKTKVLGADAGPDAVTEGARATRQTKGRGSDLERQTTAGGVWTETDEDGDGRGRIDGVEKAQPVPMPLIQGEKAVDVASNMGGGRTGDGDRHTDVAGESGGRGI